MTLINLETDKTKLGNCDLNERFQRNQAINAANQHIINLETKVKNLELQINPPNNDPKIIVSEWHPSPIHETLINKSITLWGGFVDIDNDLKFDIEILLDDEIKKIINNAQSKFIAIDVEFGPWKVVTQHSPFSQTWKSAIDEMIDYTQAFKAIYPNKKVGWYNLPNQNYWDRNDLWKYQNKSLNRLMKEVDVIFPSVYDFYQNSSSDENYIKDNVKLGLEIAEGKPVYPFIMYRYHESNQNVGIQLIPITEFKSQYSYIFDVEHNGKRANGFWLWGSGEHMYRIYQNLSTDHYADKMKLILEQEFKSSGLTGEKYFDNITKTYLDILKQIIVEKGV